jgi:hypothetical protein
MSINTLQLLPQSPKTQIPTHLKFSKVIYLLKFFTQHVIEALEAFYVRQYFHEFDPHVGETSCQIRAYQMILLSMSVNKTNKFSVYRKISLLKELLGRIEQDTIHYEKVDTTPQKTNAHHTTLDQFIESNKYYFELDEVEFFLVQARILTQYKTYYGDGNPCIDYQSLTRDLGVSKHTARQLVHLYQINLSQSSCNFIMHLLSDIPSPPFSQSDLNLLKNFDDDDRYVLPCYWVMKAIYAHMLHTKKTILLSVKRTFNNQTVDHLLLPFTVTSSYGGIKYQTDISRLPDQPCFVVHGITKYSQPVEETQQTYIRRLLSMGLEKIIFLNMAIHPQYSGKKLSLLSTNPLKIDTVNPPISNYIGLEQEFLTLQRQAEIFGCSINNPSLFYIEHIYCDKLGRLMNLIEPRHQELAYTDGKELIPNYYGIEQYA